MRRVLGVVCGLIALACSEQAPSSPEPFVSLASILGASAAADHGSAHGPVTVFATQLRSEFEFPTCVSASQGEANIKVRPDGTIESHVNINNKGAENVFFGHIHHKDVGSQTGPIVWWLTSPFGARLNLTDRHLSFIQDGVFSATNGHFATHAAALAAFLANPSQFYVNFHSTRCPPGFIRGNLP